MKIIIDAGHGYQTAGKRSKNGMKEYEFNRKVAMFVQELFLDYSGLSLYFVHSDQRDIPLKERVNKANQLKADLYISIHANAFGSGEWNSANGIETFIFSSRPKEALDLAISVQKQLILKTNRKDRGVKAADYYVLRETAMTAILCECGFMTNKEEAQLLMTESYQRKCAEAIVFGVSSFYGIKKVQQFKARYSVQVGAFQMKKGAETLKEELISKGFDAIVIEKSL
ncbi:N-acetylmuramoyl-L-alanine amidase [Litchfieldia salsa]|uniref:N-acetylmuramoyl-L-alanine amidase n=1 Tax=Litchfieldia salsa TaxID=930152 RepID=A0A1H0S3P4_9BACI|nr:N-acetylmuramoyl-L-alanine amidase [Litchfieldia salsa]SDP36277.1 N-acetylmuramoyl-L-alanine amidase [Litchfieldia salsa]